MPVSPSLERPERHALTLVGRIDPSDVDRAAADIDASGGVALSVTPLTEPPVEAVQIRTTELDPSALGASLGRSFGGRALGFALRPSELSAMVPGLWIMDVDSTLIEDEVIDELARVAGRYEEVAEVTERAMNGELDFEAALRARCRALAGLPEPVFAEVGPKLRVRAGAPRLIRALQAVGCRTAVVSGGFIQTVKPLASSLGIDFALANELEVRDGALTGDLVGDVVDGDRKLSFFRDLAERLAVPWSRTVAVGDGANDLPMIGAAGLGIAFCAKAKVRERAPVTVDLPRLDATAHHLGWSNRDLELLGG